MGAGRRHLRRRRRRHRRRRAAVAHRTCGSTLGPGARRHRRLRRALRPRPGPLPPARCSSSSTDGVGTKLRVARATGRYDTVGIDLVAMCVDDLVCVGAEPLFLLDYIATGKVDPDQMRRPRGRRAPRAAGRPAARCSAARWPSTPASIAPGEFDLAGFAVGVVERDAMLGPERVVRRRRARRPASRRACARNGYTLARHVLLERAGLDLDDPAWDGCGPLGRRRAPAPSVIYAPGGAAPCARDLGDALHASAHITGGGIAGQPDPCPPRRAGRRARPVALGRAAGLRRDRAAWARWPRTRWTRVFNLGIGMVAGRWTPAPSAPRWRHAGRRRAGGAPSSARSSTDGPGVRFT